MFKIKNKHLGICSGFFFAAGNFHIGHLHYLQAAKERCTDLLVVVNSNAQLKEKGRPVIFSDHARLELTKALKVVDYALLSVERPPQMNIVNTLDIVNKMYASKYKKVSLFNSGDRNRVAWNKDEEEFCHSLGWVPTYIRLPKEDSTSNIIERIKNFESTKK
jgi:cytidyltransferase-like protein